MFLDVAHCPPSAALRNASCFSFLLCCACVSLCVVWTHSLCGSRRHCANRSLRFVYVALLFFVAGTPSRCFRRVGGGRGAGVPPLRARCRRVHRCFSAALKAALIPPPLAPSLGVSHFGFVQSVLALALVHHRRLSLIMSCVLRRTAVRRCGACVFVFSFCGAWSDVHARCTSAVLRPPLLLRICALTREGIIETRIVRSLRDAMPVRRCALPRSAVYYGASAFWRQREPTHSAAEEVTCCCWCCAGAHQVAREGKMKRACCCETPAHCLLRGFCDAPQWIVCSPCVSQSWQLSFSAFFSSLPPSAHHELTGAAREWAFLFRVHARLARTPLLHAPHSTPQAKQRREQLARRDAATPGWCRRTYANRRSHRAPPLLDSAAAVVCRTHHTWQRCRGGGHLTAASPRLPLSLARFVMSLDMSRLPVDSTAFSPVSPSAPSPALVLALPTPPHPHVSLLFSLFAHLSPIPGEWAARTSVALRPQRFSNLQHLTSVLAHPAPRIPR